MPLLIGHWLIQYGQTQTLALCLVTLHHVVCNKRSTSHLCSPYFLFSFGLYLHVKANRIQSRASGVPVLLFKLLESLRVIGSHVVQSLVLHLLTCRFHRLENHLYTWTTPVTLRLLKLTHNITLLITLKKTNPP